MYLPIVIPIPASEVGMYRYVHAGYRLYTWNKTPWHSKYVLWMPSTAVHIFIFAFSYRTSVNSRSAINQAASGGFPSSTQQSRASRLVAFILCTAIVSRQPISSVDRWQIIKTQLNNVRAYSGSSKGKNIFPYSHIDNTIRQPVNHRVEENLHWCYKRKFALMLQSSVRFLWDRHD